MSDIPGPDPTPPDDHLWSLLDRFLAGECSGEEADEVRAWLAAEPLNRELLESARRVWELAAARPPARSAEEAWRRTVAALDLGSLGAGQRALRRSGPVPSFTVRSSSPHRGPGRAVLGAAASLVLVAGAATVWHREHRPRPDAPAPQVTFATYSTQRGQRLSFRLIDGTRVVLAPASTLRKPSTYGTDARTLYLEGEAYFDVVHDSTRPMQVHTARATARDLGTRFVVRAYAEAPATEIVVAEGKVAVDTLVLERGHRARVAGDGRARVSTGVPLDRYFGWTEGRLVFHDTPLREVAKQLARWYDVDVRIADAGLGNRRLTASFIEPPVNEVLERIAGPLGLEVAQTSRVYTLRARQHTGVR